MPDCPTYVLPFSSFQLYITDDTLILSGANLSQEYFINRQDRYLQLRKGAGGLVDFYSNLISLLQRHDSDTVGGRQTQQTLMKNVSRLLQDIPETVTIQDSDAANDNTMAYAIPTFQAPSSWPSRIDNDEYILLQVLDFAAANDCTVYMSTGYLNPTQAVLEGLSKVKAVILTASSQCHGFAPKQNQPKQEKGAGSPSGSRRGGWKIPQAFAAISTSIQNQHGNISVYYYHREGWTFHAKGIWICSTSSKGEKSLLAACVGSGNYGHRSFSHDMESNCWFVFPTATDTNNGLQTSLIEEWDRLMEDARPADVLPLDNPQVGGQSDPSATPLFVRATLPITKRFL